MKNLRQKLQQKMGDTMPLQAVYGVGYKVVTSI
jgi:DNA-binding response OmpR family regulator